MQRRPRRARARRGDGGRAGAPRRGPGRGDLPGRPQARDAAPADPVIPGEIRGRRRARSSSTPAASADARGLNTGDRPIQVGSHFHFAETNPALPSTATRRAASASTSRRDLGALRAGRGARGRARRARRRAARPGLQARGHARMRISRDRYAALYGPTAGDRVRLADTDLWIEVERDRCVGGDEAVFGGGKTIRESMAQGTTTRAEGAPDLVITNVVVLDHWGVVKATSASATGASSRWARRATPTSPTASTRRCDRAVHRGHRRRGPDPHRRRRRLPRPLHLPADRRRGARLGHHDAHRRRHRAGRGHEGDDVHAGRLEPRAMLAAIDGRRSTSSCSARATPSRREGLREQVRAGAGGFKLHEDWGSTPAAIDACLRVADETRRPGRDPHRHAQRGRLPRVDARGDRRPRHPRLPHRGRGRRPRARHHPRSRRTRTCCPSSTNPTRPHTVNTVAEHLDMLMVCHHLNPRVPEDLAFAESRIRATTIAAEDVLHDLGAISMIGSDAQAMGRAGETILRTWQTAHAMKARLGRPGGRPGRQRSARAATSPSTRSARRSPTGIDGEVGSVEVGQARRPRALGPALLRRPPARGAQGRGDRVGADRRRERVDPDAAAGVRAADVRRLGPRGRRGVAGLRRAGGARGRPRGAARAAPRGSSPWATRAASARPTCRRTRRCRRSGSTRTPSASGSTARRSSRGPRAELPLAQRYFLF